MSHRPFSTSSPVPRGRPRRSRAAGVAAIGLTAAALTLTMAQLPASGAGVSASVLGGDELRDLRVLGDTPLAAEDIDERGTVEAALSQVNAAKALGADARWNDFGTPASLLPRDGSLGAAPGGAVAGARAWLRQHNDVLGLTDAEVASLELVNNQQLADSKARAVLFRQRFGDLAPAIGGMVTVGVGDGKVAYVSSSLVKGATAPQGAAPDPEEGWVDAATAIAGAGSDFLGAGAISAADVTDALSTDDGWTRLTVKDFTVEQQARVRALAMADGTVVPVVEANVVNVKDGLTAAYTALVDANGKTLWRQSQVDQFADVPTGVNEGVRSGIGMPVMEDNPSAAQFQGEFTTSDCGPKHPFKITDTETRQIIVSATAVNPANDILVKIFGPDGGLLTSGDLGTSPEYAIATADPFDKGTYTAQVCMFEGAAPLPPANYVGNVSLSSSEGAPDAGAPFPPKWQYFTTNPTPRFDKDHTPKNDVVGCWVTADEREKVEGCTEPNGPLRNLGSRAPWDVNPNSELPSFTTFGNNASDREAWFSPLTPGGFFQAVVSPTREYVGEFTDAWNNSECSPSNFVPGGNDVLYSATNLFVSHNKMHDYSYFLGFTEKNYNLQQNNFGAGGANGDPEVGNVQAGAASGGSAGQYLGRDNANQIALQDGVPGITNQYLFQPIAGAFYAPCTDGGLDFGIVGHEYTHAISNRMIGGPDEGITSEQGGSMGESWGDLVAGEYQFSHGYRNGGNLWAVGLYATGNKQVAIRDYAINHNPLTYGEFGFDTTGPEVHADGEIWNATMWRVRQALVDKYNARYPYTDMNLQERCSKGLPNVGPEQAPFCPGNRRWVQLMFDSFLLQQGATSMLDARDAMIAADQLRFEGMNKKVLWAAFARSGMGKSASTPDADSSEPKPSFTSSAGDATVRFAPRLANGDPVSGEVFIGNYEARATPVADTLEDTKLDASIPMTPGTYPAVFRSPQTGLTRFKVVVGGADLVRRIPVSVNYAGSDNGATVVDTRGGSRNADYLIDGTEATNWGGVTKANVDKTNPSVTVDLSGKTRTIRRVVVSAMLRPAAPSVTDIPLFSDVDEDPDSGSRFTALRKFAIEACASSCDSAGSWKRVYTSPGNAFPGKRPRPVAPNLNFRTFSFDPVKAQQVRLVVLENQCTGYEGYAGEQDADPTNSTDCRSASDRGTIVHAAELEVFGS